MSENDLKTILDSLYESRSKHHLLNDPLSFCHRFKDPGDQEIAGLIAASFAYGNVKIILRNLEQIFSVIGPSPKSFVNNFDPTDGLIRFSGFKHRFNDARDLTALIFAIRTILDKAGSIEAFFLTGMNSGDPDITESLKSFSASIRSFDYSRVFGTISPPDSSNFSFFFPSPSDGSACKRLCMYLRWMVRPMDGMDLGLWHTISPARLIIPVDAHIKRICSLIGLTSRKQADWKMAQEITAALRRIDPLDPVRYDFSLCHLGISEGCNGNVTDFCKRCVLAGICAGPASCKNI